MGSMSSRTRVISYKKMSANIYKIKVLPGKSLEFHALRAKQRKCAKTDIRSYIMRSEKLSPTTLKNRLEVPQTAPQKM